MRPGILLPSDLTLPVSSLPILLPTQTHKPKERQGEKKTQNGKVGNQSKVRPILGNIFNVFVFSEKNLLQHVLPANLRGVCGVTCNFLISEVSNTGFPALLESGDVISSSGLLLGQHITKLFHTIVGADTSKYNIVLH